MVAKINLDRSAECSCVYHNRGGCCSASINFCSVSGKVVSESESTDEFIFSWALVSMILTKKKLGRKINFTKTK